MASLRGTHATAIALPNRQQVVVIGGGQAGLATAAELRARDVAVTVLDAGSEVGHVWRSRWDSLRLFTPARLSALPGVSLAGDPDRYPTKDEVANYLRDYAGAFSLDVRTGVRVERVGIDEDGFRLTTTNGEIVARCVVVATGPFQAPHVPALAAGLAPEVVQRHSADYRRPAELPDGDVVVVGGGNSGFQIAAELAATHRVHLAVGGRARTLPQRIAGRDVFWWLTRTGLLEVSGESPLGRRMRTRELLIGTSPRVVRHLGVQVHPWVTSADDTTLGFADGGVVEVAAVIWATGYRRDHRFVEVPGALDERGVLVQRGVRTPIPGLYAIGQPWQRDRGSALLGFVGREAAEIARPVEEARLRGE